MRCRVRWATEPATLSGRDHAGDARGPLRRRRCNATWPLCGLGGWIVVGAARSAAWAWARGRPDQRDRDRIGIRVPHSPHCLQPRPAVVSKEPRMHHPNPPEPTPAAREAAAGHRRGRPRRPRPGPPGFTIEVQVLGGEAGRRLDQEQTEAIAAVLAWLAAHPPTAAAGSAATIDAPAEPRGFCGRQHAEDGRARGHADPQAERSRPLRRAGQPGGWRVVVELPASGSGAGAGAGGGGPAGGGGRPGAGRAPGGGAPLGLAGLA
jgi:hypothetical protein